MALIHLANVTDYFWKKIGEKCVLNGDIIPIRHSFRLFTFTTQAVKIGFYGNNGSGCNVNGK
jgi:hypothetical protein